LFLPRRRRGCGSNWPASVGRTSPHIKQQIRAEHKIAIRTLGFPTDATCPDLSQKHRPRKCRRISGSAQSLDGPEEQHDYRWSHAKPCRGGSCRIGGAGAAFMPRPGCAAASECLQRPRVTTDQMVAPSVGDFEGRAVAPRAVMIRADYRCACWRAPIGRSRWRGLLFFCRTAARVVVRRRLNAAPRRSRSRRLFTRRRDEIGPI